MTASGIRPLLDMPKTMSRSRQYPRKKPPGWPGCPFWPVFWIRSPAKECVAGCPICQNPGLSPCRSWTAICLLRLGFTPRRSIYLAICAHRGHLRARPRPLVIALLHEEHTNRAGHTSPGKHTALRSHNFGTHHRRDLSEGFAGVSVIYRDRLHRIKVLSDRGGSSHARPHTKHVVIRVGGLLHG